MLKKPLFLLIMFLSNYLFAQDAQITWRTFPDEKFQVNGLVFWQENKPDLYRLAKSQKNSVRDRVWSLAQSPSGGRIRFQSDCSTLAIQLQYPHKGNMINMHVYGQCGVDLYIDNQYIKTAIPKDSTLTEFVFFNNQKKQMRNITLYLPVYSNVKVLAIGTDSEAAFDKPLPFALDKPVVFYGSSITQGGCASRPGMSYQAIIGRNLNIDIVNHGYSGNGMGEPEMAQILADIDAACYVIDFGVNLPSVDSLGKVYGPFMDILCQKHPHTPIIVVTPIFQTHEFWGPAKPTFMRDIVRKEVARLRNAENYNILLVEGFELLGPDMADGLVDGVHPNDLGFQSMAEGLQPYLARMLNLSGNNYKLK